MKKQIEKKPFLKRGQGKTSAAVGSSKILEKQKPATPKPEQRKDTSQI